LGVSLSEFLMELTRNLPLLVVSLLTLGVIW
jgi:hypothetical protein